MRPITALPYVFVAAATLVVGQIACSGNSGSSGFPVDDGGNGGSSGGSSGGSGSGGSSGGSGGSSGGFIGDGGFVGDGSSPTGPEGSTTVSTTVYAHTDDTLYQVDPMHQTITEIGVMVGTSDSSTDSTITDLAVDGNGDVWVNSESVVYKATLPSSPGTVQLTKVTTIGSTARFYALAFAPAGALDPNNETLVGGDSDGNLWSINTSTGASTNLGNFGSDPTTSGNIFELSGDIVFYNNSMNQPTGLATIRSCQSGGSSSTCGNDFLAGVNMANLKLAYNGTPQTTLLGGIYGGNGNNLGSGTGYHDVFGLGAWNSTVFGFTRHTTTQTSPMLITIDTTSGAGTVVDSNFSFTNGWSGAGVTTKVTITAPPPPPPPAQ
jgi:hypothetical protein